MKGERIWNAARALIGVPFRLHGRSAATGLDCVGLVLLSLRSGGLALAEPPPYRLHTSVELPVARLMGAAGFYQAADAQTGDVLLARLSAMQLHLMIGGPGAAVVHAHAGLGRVVEMPCPAEWAILSRWRA